jgi:hypothetical protein
MQWVIDCLSGFVGFLCRIFGVTTDSIRAERERNPSPTRQD